MKHACIKVVSTDCDADWVQNVRDVIPQLPIAEEAAQYHSQTVQGLEQYLTNIHNEWWAGIAANLQMHLDAGLIYHVSLASVLFVCMPGGAMFDITSIGICSTAT